MNLKKINEQFVIDDMATVGRFMSSVGELTVEVRGRDNGDVPHVHIYSTKHDKDAIFNGAVRLDKPEYFDHGPYRSHFNAKDRKAFNEFMRAKRGRRGVDSNYDFSVDQWNVEYRRNFVPDVDDNNELIVPDYTKL